jgi:hypothetical protein
MVASFAIGIRSAGDLTTVGAIEAAAPEQQVLPGDMDNDGELTSLDALIAAELIRSGAEATDAQLVADPSGDARITLDDVLLILRHVAR